jgi:hypothetical protein
MTTVLSQVSCRWVIAIAPKLTASPFEVVRRVEVEKRPQCRIVSSSPVVVDDANKLTGTF